MNTPTVKELLASLQEKGKSIYWIAHQVGHAESALYKIARGEQDSVSYEIGKRIELLDAATPAKKRGKR